jgi:hypothetical protein
LQIRLCFVQFCLLPDVCWKLFSTSECPCQGKERIKWSYLVRVQRISMACCRSPCMRFAVSFLALFQRPAYLRVCFRRRENDRLVSSFTLRSQLLKFLFRHRRIKLSVHCLANPRGFQVRNACDTLSVNGGLAMPTLLGSTWQRVHQRFHHPVY